MKNGTNAHSKPQFEGDIIKFISPHHPSVILYDICKRNEKYGNLEWHALNNPTKEEMRNAFWI